MFDFIQFGASGVKSNALSLSDNLCLMFLTCSMMICATNDIPLFSLTLGGESYDRDLSRWLAFNAEVDWVMCVQ